MLTLDFFKRVLPETGLYCCMYMRPGQHLPTHKFFQTKEELRDCVLELDAQGGHSIYMAMASFSTARRKQENVKYLRSVYIDVDCGLDKPFANWREGLQAVSDFVTYTGLPRPMIVFSGNGLHVYWPFDRDVEPGEFLPIAHIIKSWVPMDSDDHPVFDPKIPTDTARVLRPVGTHHQNPAIADIPKSGNSVHVLFDCPTVCWDEFAEYVLNNAAKFDRQNSGASIQSVAATLSAPQGNQQRQSAVNLSTRADLPPADPVVVRAKCRQVDWAVTNADQVREPLWYALLGVAAYCHDPQQTAVEWSSGHPDFNQIDTLKKLDHWKQSTSGPATCQRFRDERPKGCTDCPFKDKITSPAMIGLKYDEVEVAMDAPDDFASEIPMPYPFKRTQQGIKIVIDETDVDAFPFDLYPVSYGRDNTLGYEVVRYKWRRPHVGWQPLVFRQAYLAAGGSREFATALADQGIVIGAAKKLEHSQMLLRNYMDELRKMQSVSDLYGSFGWKRENTEFLLGKQLIKADGVGTISAATVFNSASVSDDLASAYTTKGTLKDFVDFTEIFQTADMPMHKFAMMVSASAPLYKLTGLSGGVINFYGPTGAGKSLAQMEMQAVWGNPTVLHTTAKTTLNALFERMGEYNDLIFTVDEATLFSNRELSEILYCATIGEGKARMTSEGRIRDTAKWNTPMITSANRTISSALAAAGDQTEARLQRLLELQVDRHTLFSKSTEVGAKMYHFLNNNYGHVGKAIVESMLKQGTPSIVKEIEQHRADFLKRYGVRFAGEERFWEQFILLADYAGERMKREGLIKFDYRDGTVWAASQLNKMRQVSGELAMTSFDIIGEYLNSNSDKSVVVFYVGAETNGTPDQSRMPRGELRVRYNLLRSAAGQPVSRGVVLIDRKHFRTWCSSCGFDYREVMSDVMAAGVDATPQSKKAFLGKDTPVKVPQTYVFGINLNSPQFKGIMTDLDEPMLGQPQLVKEAEQ